MDGPEILTVREVARWLRVSEQTILRELIRGHMIGFKVRGAWRVQRASVEAYMAQSPAPEVDELSTYDVARRIGRSRETAWRLMSSGKLPATRRGKSWYATPEAVQQWIDDQRPE